MAIRTIEVRERVMARNDALAATVREQLAAHGVPAFNLVSSPGAGKTALLERTLATVGEELGISVITGDVQTDNDAVRLAAHTDRIVSAVITGGACHLDALQVQSALEAIDLDATGLLFIENVGNLVCPANWDLGEQGKIVLFSVTEGEDKPLKYPAMFERSSHVVMTKTDLLAHVPFDIELAIANARRVNPDLEVLRVSSLDGSGLADWFDFLRRSVARARVHVNAG
jgi:hydrogenase nickel incorporation protein HypB